jgi:uncharacterized membrane protein
MITSTIEIERPQAEVFAYIDQIDQQPEWQESLTAARLLGEGPVGVGTRYVETRKVPGGPRDMTYEVTEYDPPNKSSWRGVDGPVRAVGGITVEALGESRSRVTVAFDLNGHGIIGMLVAPIARRQAGKQVPTDQQKLKEILERGATPSASAETPASPPAEAPASPPSETPEGPAAGEPASPPDEGA